MSQDRGETKGWQFDCTPPPFKIHAFRAFKWSPSLSFHFAAATAPVVAHFYYSLFAPARFHTTRSILSGHSSSARLFTSTRLRFAGSFSPRPPPADRAPPRPIRTNESLFPETSDPSCSDGERASLARRKRIGGTFLPRGGVC